MNRISKDNNLLKYFSLENLLLISKLESLNFKAKIIVTELFKDKKDKSGAPYLGHLYRVSERLSDEREKVAGLLHDVLEDTDITVKDLYEVGIPTDIIEMVKLVTHKKIDKSNMTEEEKLKLYNAEIDKIINSGNIHAIRLKAADVADNFSPSRLRQLSNQDQEWFEKKYSKQLVKLNNAKGDRNI